MSLTPNSPITRADYFKRIGYEGPALPTKSTLDALQTAHIMSIAYENLDILFRRTHSLESAAILEKLITRHRGGYCFELNGGFAILLRDLGFRVVEYFGRWLEGEKESLPRRRHRILRVALEDGDYLVDVGVGQRAPLTPLRYEMDTTQFRNGLNYRLKRDDVLGVVLYQEQGAENWVRIYSWDETAQNTMDFDYAHYFLCHHESSPFLNGLLVHLPSQTGRRTLFLAPDPQNAGAKACFFARSDAAEKVKEARRIDTRAQFETILATEFKIPFQGAEVAYAPWLKS